MRARLKVSVGRGWGINMETAMLNDLNERIPDSVRWAFIVIVFTAMTAAGISFLLLQVLALSGWQAAFVPIGIANAVMCVWNLWTGERVTAAVTGCLALLMVGLIIT
jgi:hypothetical protein